MQGKKSSPNREDPGVRSLPYEHNFTKGSSVDKKKEQLVKAGLAGVDFLNGPEVQRLTSKSSMLEIEMALAHAEKVGQETGLIPEVYGLDLVHLTRLVQASKNLPSDMTVAENARLERENLYQKIAQAAGAIAVEDSITDI